MPLHLLGKKVLQAHEQYQRAFTDNKKSWNVYNADNIARVKADEAAAAAREAADEQRMQELDTERRLALLRGRTPPPLPEEDAAKDAGRRSDKDRDARGHDRKRRKLAGEDDTAMEIRIAASMTASKGDGGEPTNILKLRNTTSDAPLTDHAGNIDLFPVDMKEAIKRERNAEAEKEKKKKERALEDQYTMRFSNAAGFKNGLSQPWYATGQKPSQEAEKGKDIVAYEGIENKNVWGNEDPRRKEREIARITSNDPFAAMQKAQVQLKKSKEDKKKWAEERDRELRELRATQEREERRSRHRKRKTRDERDDDANETVRTYFAYPKDGSTQNAILIMTDVIGMDFPNIQLIADQFAANGYFTVIPDVFNGNEIPFPPPATFSLQEYIKTKMPRPPTVDPIYATVIKHLRSELGVQKLGGVGYCFGGKYVCRWLKEGGFGEGGLTRGSLRIRVLWMRRRLGGLGGRFLLLLLRRLTEDILRELSVPYQMCLYSDTEHGFGVKGDLSNAKQKFAKEQAFLQAVQWFDYFIKKG
ncbi:hypothetical protein N0V83_002364 [Neocucurbitaria cava]|uniref:CBF1-interacting co-repressor CIR N-terminal domain-containing protein n=1 Tax=Neocucurbitaria cava TaxID=798079 RepID=A0A9W9CQR4_9PLEO|nr:hypothetical protein N0V83_002364 [Neocucurbitaria cava]